MAARSSQGSNPDAERASPSLPMPIDPQALYVQLGRLVEAMPDLQADQPLSTSTQEWLGRVAALIAASGDVADIADFQTHALLLSKGTTRFYAAQDLGVIVRRALAKAELNAPASAQGSFVPAGNVFDAMSAIGKILGQAKRDVLIVDPYMDEKALTDFALLAPERIGIRLLFDLQTVKSTLRPAAARWTAQYGTSRPLEAKLAPARMLHDRLIAIDDASAWILTQSLNAFATRSPASIVRVDEETAKLKITAYQAIWGQATPLTAAP
jgi:hypothetical protein